jgi:hypothetical protein
VGWGLEVKAGKRTRRQWSRIVLSSASEATRVPVASLCGLAVVGPIPAIPRLRVEGKGDVSQPFALQAATRSQCRQQAAGFAYLNQLADLRGLGGQELRAVHLQYPVGSTVSNGRETACAAVR